MMWGRKGRARVIPVVALLLLCFLWAGGTLRADLLPGLMSGSMPRLERQVLPLGLLAILAGVVAMVRRAEWPRSRLLLDSIWIGLGLFAVPAGLMCLAGGWVPGPARAALLTLVPVFAVVFEPYIGRYDRPQVRGGLMAALLAVVGSLLVFPVAIPASIEAGLALVAVVLAAACIAAGNCFGVAVATAPSGSSRGRVMAMASIAGAAAAVVLAVASASLERPVWTWEVLTPELIWSAAVEAPALLLLFWLMANMSAPRMAARYVLAPLLAIVIGVVLLRSEPEVRMLTWLGLVLMSAGTAWILFAREEEAGSSKLPLDLAREQEFHDQGPR